MTSRVVPAVSETIAASRLAMALSRLDLPTLGGPTMAIDEMFFNSGYSFDSASGVKLETLRGGPIAATRDGIGSRP